MCATITLAVQSWDSNYTSHFRAGVKHGQILISTLLLLVL